MAARGHDPLAADTKQGGQSPQHPQHNTKQEHEQMAQHNELGAYGEDLTRYWLSKIGEVTHKSKGDLTFEGVTIEVKTARRSRNANRYQFCLVREGKTDYRKAKIIVLIAVDATGHPLAVFIIPTDKIPTCKKISLRGDFSGRWAPFRERWELIADYV